jgi:hypothetical protein
MSNERPTGLAPECKAHDECQNAVRGPGPGCEGVCLRRYPEYAIRRPKPIALAPGLSCIDRRPGHEVVLSELIGARVLDSPRLLFNARRLYLASMDEETSLYPDWETLGAGTVRTWVRVAREAAAIFGGGR